MHVFNIISKLKNLTSKKSIKLFFCVKKNDVQISRVTAVRKAPSP